MDFDFSEDQESLRDAVRRWVDKGFSFERRHALAKAGGATREVYGELAELGLAGLVVPEAHGGMGLGAIEAMVVSEELGRGLVNAPYAAAALMAPHLQEQQVIQFLLSSLLRDADGVYRWRFNLEGIKRDYQAVREAPTGVAPYRGPVQFIKGGDSNYIQEHHRPAIVSRFPEARVKIMPGCGHWLHAERPSLFNGMVSRFLARALSGVGKA